GPSAACACGCRCCCTVRARSARRSPRSSRWPARCTRGWGAWARGGGAPGGPVAVAGAPQLSTVPFRLARRAGEALAAWNARNESWMARINARGRVLLSSTLLPEEDGVVFSLRACILSFRTHADRIDALLEDAQATLPAASLV